MYEEGTRHAHLAGELTFSGRPFRNVKWFDVDASDNRRPKAGPIDSETTQPDVRDVRPPMALIAVHTDSFDRYFFGGD